MPMTANIIQTMKHTVNAVVLAVTTDQPLYACDAIARSLALEFETKVRRAGIGRFDPSQLKMYFQSIFKKAALESGNTREEHCPAERTARNAVPLPCA
jgi:hypothetical protein